MKTIKNISSGNSLQSKRIPDFIQQLQKLIVQQITQKEHQLALENLAISLQISRKTLERKIKAHTQQTAKQHLHEFRLQYAHRILEGGVYTNTQELAADLGYSNASHFALIFKKRFGYTPKTLLLKQQAQKAQMRKNKCVIKK